MCPLAFGSAVERIEHTNNNNTSPTVMSPQNTPATQIQPYLFFGGRCEEAIEFYRDALDAEVVMLMRMHESPDPHPPGMMPPGSENKIMHACLRVGDATFMMSDGCCSGETNFDGFSLSLTLPNESQVDRAFAALAEGGEVRMPPGKTFWSPQFGMVADKYGVGWMLSVPIENMELAREEAEAVAAC